MTARLGEVEWRTGRLDEALERMERAFAELEGEEPDADVAALAAQLGRLHVFRYELEEASERIETALELAESLWLPEVLAEGLNTKGVIAARRLRVEEATALLERSLALALEYELPASALRAYNNIADTLHRRDRCDEAATMLEQGLALARRVGHRHQEAYLLGELSWSLAQTGRWQAAFECFEQVPETRLAEGSGVFVLSLIEPLVAQGRLDEAHRLMSLHARMQSSADVQERTLYRAGEIVLLRAEGRDRELLDAADEVFATGEHQAVKLVFPRALEAALGLGELEHAERILGQVETLPAGRLAPTLRAHALRYRARLAARKGDAARAEAGFGGAAAILRELARAPR